MKKMLFFAATALVALGSCTSDEFVGDENVREANENSAIVFGSGLKAFTRADATGATAAGKLNNTFYVYGIKNEETDGIAATTGNLVYNNYIVKWTDNTAYTTTSNTENWEYVGYSLTADKDATNVTPNSGAGTAQTIKYWDYGATDYVFYAFSAKPSDLEDGKVKVAKTVSVTSPATVYDKGYTVTLGAEASLDDLYFSERVPITKSTNTDRTADNTYGGNVTFRFHNLTTKVRVAMYETLPGYSVKIDKFKIADAADPAFSAMTTEESTNFKANFVNSAAGTAGSMTVTYVASGETQNHPTVAFAPTSGSANILELGGQIISATAIGETAATATYDKTVGGDTKAYTSVFPKETNTQNLKLKVCYTLTAPVTGETITVTDATAEIPAEYLKWKPGYAYTYIFKISDNTNGSSGTPGTDPAGLYPITFDAVVVDFEDGKQETITTVSEPSITTFGYNATNKEYVTGGNEYPAGSDIYATIMDGSSVKDFTLDTDVKVYAVTTSDATNFPITEASVAEAITEDAGSGTKVITATQITSSAYETYLTAAPSKVTSVPSEDGNTKTINALKLTGVKYVANYVYVVEYNTGKWNTTGKTYESAPAGVQLYSDADGTTTATWANNSTTYYTRTVPKNVYKVIKVASGD